MLNIIKSNKKKKKKVKYIGAYIPEELYSFLILRCVANGTTKSDEFRAIIEIVKKNTNIEKYILQIAQTIENNPEIPMEKAIRDLRIGGVIEKHIKDIKFLLPIE